MNKKLAKLKNNILSVLHVNKKKEKKVLDNEGNSTPNSTIRNQTFQSPNAPITARQLEEYYNSLKRENVVLTDNLINNSNHSPNSNVSNGEAINSISNVNKWNNAESTNIEQDDSIICIENETVSQQPEENAVIIFNENVSNFDSNLDDSEPLGIISLYSQPDPLERANLVQLKKMMELEKYRKYRLSYLREHTRHLNNSGINKVSKSIKAKKYRQNGMKFNIKDIPADRMNKSGMFGISLLDTLDGDDVETPESETIKPLNDNVAKKLKFVDTKSEAANFDMGSKPRSFNAEDEKPKKEKAVTSIASDSVPTTGLSFGTAKSTIEPKISSISKVTEENTSIDEQPSSAFKFNPPQPTKKHVLPPLNKPKETATFLFDKKDNKIENKMPALNFGGLSGTPQTSSSTTSILETVPDKDGLGDTSMNFKPKSQIFQAPKSEIDSESKNKEDHKPLFGGFAKPAETKTDLKTVTESKIPSLFGSLSDSASKPTSTPAFSFDNKPKENTVANDKANKISLSFGNFAAPKSESKDLKPFTPSLNFDISEKQEAKTEPKTLFGAGSGIKADGNSAFTFGSTTTAKPEDDKPKMVFGSMPNSSDNNTEKPKISFGLNSTLKSEEKSKFTFGSTTDSKTETKPTFSIPSKTSTETTKEEEKKTETNESKFAFGNPTLTFGSDLNNNQTTTDLNLKPSEGSKFNFGTNNPVPSFNLNSTAASKSTDQNTTGSVFGSSTNPTVIKPSETKFNFGLNTAATKLALPDAKTITDDNVPASNAAKSNLKVDFTAPNTTSAFSGFTGTSAGTSAAATNKPSFSFGTTATNTTPSNVFGASNSNNNGDKNISSNSIGAFGNPPSSSSTGFSFGNNNAMKPSPSSVFGQSSTTPNTGSSNGSNNQATNKIFSINNTAFPSLNNLPKPMSGFNNNSNNMAQKPNFNFGGNANPAGASGFQSANSAFSANAGVNPNMNGGINNNSNGNMFGGNTAGNFGNMNSGGAFGNTAAGAFNFTGNGGGSAPNSVGNSRASTPSFNFTGGQTANINPSTIFQAQAQSQSATPPLGGPPSIASRKKAYPRSMRNRR